LGPSRRGAEPICSILSVAGPKGPRAARRSQQPAAVGMRRSGCGDGAGRAAAVGTPLISSPPISGLDASADPGRHTVNRVRLVVAAPEVRRPATGAPAAASSATVHRVSSRKLSRDRTNAAASPNTSASCRPGLPWTRRRTTSAPMSRLRASRLSGKSRASSTPANQPTSWCMSM